jgi:predicted solute-binding protein
MEEASGVMKQRVISMTKTIEEILNNYHRKRYAIEINFNNVYYRLIDKKVKRLTNKTIKQIEEYGKDKSLQTD